MKNFFIYLLALIAGAVYPLGFAPFAQWPVSIASLIILILLIISPKETYSFTNKPRKHRPVLIGFIYGLGLFGVGVSWVYISMVNFGNMPPVLAGIAVFVFVTALSSFTALFAFFASKSRSSFHILLTIPAIWILSEALRGWVLTGLPWLLLGYASLDSPFSAWAPIAGVMGSSFIFAFIASTIALFLLFPKRWVLALVSFGLIAGGTFALEQLNWSKPTGHILRAALVQRNISLADKWRPGQETIIRNAYLRASKAVNDVDLIVWPEAAIPQLLDRVPSEFYSEARKLPGELILGGVESNVLQSDQGESSLYNSMLVLGEPDTTDAQPQIYRKKHLVPYGEYFPLKWLLGGLMESLQIPMSNFSSWQLPQSPLEIAHVKLAPTICYEDAFPEEWRLAAGQSEILLNISEDAWFGDSFAPHQRLEMARFRALEMARPMIRVSNSGLSAFIDSNGQIDKLSPQFQEAVLQGTAEGHVGLTPYVRYGRWPLYGLMALLVFLGFALFRSKANLHAFS